MNAPQSQGPDEIDQPIQWEPSLLFLEFATAFVGLGAVFFVAVLLVFVPHQLWRILAVLSLVAVSACAWLFLRRGRIRHAMWTLAIGVWIFATGTSIFLGGVNGPATVIYPLAILLVGWLAGSRAAYGVAVLTSATALVFVVLEQLGRLPAPPPTPAALRWVIGSGVWIGTAALIVSVVRSYRHRLEDVQELGGELNRAQAVAHVGSWVFDISSDRMLLSAETCRIFGLPEGTVGSHNAYLKRVHPDDRPAVDAAWRTALAGGAAFDHAHRIVVGPNVRWVRQVAEIERLADGTPNRCVGTTQDVTELKRHDAEILAARAQLQATLDAIPDVLFEVDLDGRYLDVHSPRTDLLAAPREQLLGRTVRDVLPPAAAAVALEALREAHAVGRSSGRQFELPLPQGALWFELSVSTKPGEPGAAPRFLVLSRDISIRKHAEEALRVKEAQLECILGSTADGILAVDLEGRVIQTNQRFAEMWRIPSALLDSKDDHAFLDFAAEQVVDADGFISRVRRLYGVQAESTDTLAFRDGRFFERYSAPLIINGTLTGRVWSFRDVTDRKKAEAELLDRDHRLAAVFQASPLPIIVSRLSDGRFLDLNDAAVRLYGGTRADLLGQGASELGIYPDPGRRDDLVRELRERGGVDRFPLDIRLRDGDLRAIEAFCRVIIVGGEPYIVAMLMDVTERKRLEEAHLQAQKLESLGTLAGGIAHDFNNVLAAIRGNADLAAEHLDGNHAAAPSVAEIRKATSRASELVRRITVFGRPKEARQEVVDLRLVVEEVLRLLRSTLPAGITLSTEFGDDAPQVIADAGQVHEVIVNLTTNAAHAIGSRGGSIVYRLESVTLTEADANDVPGLKSGRYARLTVSDTGCGMDGSTLERIFDAFYTTKPVGEGVGLGLSMVHGTMKSHGGAVTAESTPGVGSRFAVYFRAAEVGVHRVSVANTDTVPVTVGRRVLFVDDEEALVLVADRLLSLRGHAIAGFSDPRDALAAFRERPDDFDVLVSDLSMPGLSGFELARAVISVRPQLPVVLMTGWLREQDEAAARKIGIRELMLKPVSMAELHQAIEELFRTASPTA